MIIDVHGHWGPWFFTTEVGDVDANVRLMDEHGIDLQLVSAVEAVVYDAVGGNESLATVIAGHDRVRGLAVIDPRRLEEAAAQLPRLLASGDFVGAKIHTHYSSSPPESAAMHSALELCAQLDIPVLVHTWGEELLGLGRAVRAVQGVRAIAAHAGGPAWRTAPEALAMTDRLWTEPCYSIAEAGRIRWLLDRVDPRRVLFGSDSTLIDPAVTLGAFEAADLDERERRLVMSENALALFRIDR